MENRRSSSTRVMHNRRAVRRIAGTAPPVVDGYFVPTRGLDLAPYLAARDQRAVHHIIRYRWAIAALQERRVRHLLDVGCGSGFGSAMLADAFPRSEVVGADYDENAVANAWVRHGRHNLTFVVGDATRWDEMIDREPFDCIVSFDTIEHVRHREIMLMNVVDHLDADGAFLMSTPSARSTVNLRPDWRFHQIEYSRRAAFDFLSRYFLVVLRPDDGSLPAMEEFDVLAGSRVTYALVMNPLLCLQPIRIGAPY